jgi:hypothetical protein
MRKSIEESRRQRLLDGLAEDFAKLRANSSKWIEELLEREAWDETLGDGLDEE